ncbi:MAG TPA: hypothetical protein VFL96_15055 [Acidobacteriaceae bacterium]|nr:hypothetical protein [Acidobacteriaceae bacterium]
MSGAHLLACPEGIEKTAEEILQITSDSRIQAACRKSPINSNQAIVAFARMATNKYQVIVDIAVVDIPSGNILSYRHSRDDFEWTGGDWTAGFVGITVDTARYDLAPGLRAFGIRIEQHEGCGQGCEITSTHLALYAQRGMKLQKLLSTSVGEHEDGSGPDGEGYAAHRSVTVLCMGGQRSHGLANIWSSESRVDSDSPDEAVDIDAADIPCGPTAPNRALWRYNGRQYVAK